jgi:hypothetical protein
MLHVSADSFGFDRKMSAPVFRTTEEHPNMDEMHLTRTSEVENIVEEEEREEARDTKDSMSLQVGHRKRSVKFNCLDCTKKKKKYACC